MRRRLVVCRDCGYEKSVKFYERDEAERLKINLASPRCEKCGSSNVRVYD